MNVVKLYATPYMEAGNSYASYISDKQQLKVCHYHDYYEVFLVDQGYAMHHVNGKAEEISTGMLFFTRPDDIHYYDSASDNFRIINIIIDTKTINALMNYLDDEKLRTKLLDSEFPPSITRRATSSASANWPTALSKPATPSMPILPPTNPGFWPKNRNNANVSKPWSIPRWNVCG